MKDRVNLLIMYKPKSQVNGANFHANMSQVKLDHVRNSTQETIFMLENCFFTLGYSISKQYILKRSKKALKLFTVHNIKHNELWSVFLISDEKKGCLSFFA